MVIMVTFTLLLFTLVVIRHSDCANILYVMPFTSKSHNIMLKPIGLELARRGHNITVISGYGDPDPPSNYRQVVVDKKEIWDVIGGGRPNVFTMVDISAEKFLQMILFGGSLAFTEFALNSTQVKAMLAEDNKFDLVISELFYFEAMYMLSHKYKAPLILVSTFGNCMRHNIVTRNPLQLATVNGDFVDVREMSSFKGRLRNLYYSLYEYVYWRFYYLKQHEILVRKYIPNLQEPLPSLYDLQKNVSLLLTNGHFSMDSPTAYLPNIVEVGGLHLSKSKSQLPEDLQKLLDNAKHGAIYVSFGSNVRSSELPVEKREAFVNVFKKLNQIVLWKWEDDSLENKPENLIIRNWFPQKNILAHPNVKVFISHGGLIGTQEATYYGVPIIGIPIYADQFNNLLQVQSLGYGKLLEYRDVNEQNFGTVLNEVLEGVSYMTKAKQMSVRFRDRPMSALDTAMFWIEYVIRNNGASHLKNPALKLSWVAYNMLDVCAFILAAVIITMYLVYRSVALLISKIKTSTSISQAKKIN